VRTTILVAAAFAAAGVAEDRLPRDIQVKLESARVGFEEITASGPIRYQARFSNRTMLIRHDGALLRIAGEQPRSRPRSLRGYEQRALGPRKPAEIDMTLVGASREGRMDSGELLPGITRYYIAGQAPFEARTYGSVRASDVYPGIDVVYRGTGGRVEHDFIVQPGADPSAIHMSFHGSRKLRLDPNGDLTFETALETGRVRVTERRPVIYQETPLGRRMVDGGFRLEGSNRAGFEVGRYDRSLPLIVDPLLLVTVGYYGTPLTDSVLAIASNPFRIADNEGVRPPERLLIGGQTFGSFPGAQPNAGAPPDGLIMELSQDGGVTWTTVIGGPGNDGVVNVAAAQGGVFFTMLSNGTLPIVNAFQKNPGNGRYAAVGMLDQSGALKNLSYWGGAGTSALFGAGTDGVNYFAWGGTNSPNLTTTPNALSRALNGGSDAFVMEINPQGQQTYASYFGGSGGEFGATATFYNGRFWFAGLTNSSDLGTTSNALAVKSHDFVGAFDPMTASFPLISYLNNPNDLNFDGIAVDPLGRVATWGSFTALGTNREDAFFDETQFFLGPNFPSGIQLKAFSGTRTISGSGTSRFFGGVPVRSPSGAFMGFELFGETDSPFPSNLAGTITCTKSGQIWIANITSGIDGQRMGCLNATGSINSAITLSDGTIWAAGDVDAPLDPPPPLVTHPYQGGIDVALFRFLGFDDPPRLNGLAGVSQMTYIYGSQAFPNTSAGDFWIDPKLVQDGGLPVFLNVRREDGTRVVTDLPVIPGSQVLHTPIVLPNGTTPGLIGLEISLTPDPIGDIWSPPISTVPFPLLPAINNQQCIVNNTAPPPPPGTLTRTGDDTWDFELPHSEINVEASVNQCAPAAFANSLAFLAAENSNFKVRQPNNPGAGTDGSLVGALEAEMGRTPGSIVSMDKAVGGALMYAKSEGLQLDQKYTGTIRDSNGNSVADGDYTLNGVTAKRDGNVTTFKWICDQLQLGEDVEIFSIQRQNGRVIGGHAARVFGCGMTRGSAYLKILDDLVQGDNTQGTQTHDELVDDSSQGVRFHGSTDDLIELALAESLTDAVKAQAGGMPITSRNANANAGSFQANSLAPGAIGAAFGIFPPAAGQGAEPEERSEINGALATVISGTRVTIGGRPAPLYGVAPNQITYQIPPDMTPGRKLMWVESGGKRSATFTIDIGDVAPGIFRISANRGAVTNQDASLNTLANPAKVGEALVIYMTGLGKMDTPVAAGEATPSTGLIQAVAPVTATINGVTANVFFAGLTPGFTGLAQVNVIVPDLPAGEYPLVVTAGGKASNSVPVDVTP
jgi:uncharacterized protein (TIGR03437 family)